MLMTMYLLGNPPFLHEFVKLFYMAEDDYLAPMLFQMHVGVRGLSNSLSFEAFPVLLISSLLAGILEKEWQPTSVFCLRTQGWGASGCCSC